MTIIEAKRYIDSFSRPEGFNTYSWRVVKKMALNAWECHLEGKAFNRSANFMCREFYLMVQDPKGQYIIPNAKYSCHSW